MLERHIKLGRILGVEIGLHYSWIIIAILIAVSLGAHFRLTNPDWSSPTVWASAILTAILFFVGLIIHELSHAAVAKSRGLPVGSITLFALGGVAQINKEPADASTEFWMAIAGPIASIGLGMGCLLGAWALGWQLLTTPGTPFLAILVWLGYINITLAVFNMIPGYPLDGGRVLRAIVWWITGNRDKATRMAAQVGRVVAMLFIAWGILRFFGGAGFGGLWIALIGWFLLEAAGASYAQVKMTEVLRGVRVSDLMARDCAAIDSRSNLQTFVDEYLMRAEQRCFVVTEDGEIIGIITPSEVKEIPRSNWPYTMVRDVMRPLDQLRTISPDTPVAEALEAMGRDHVAQLPVASNGRLEGFITQAKVLGFLKTRAELRM
jgi:Zn-dependent protease/CBS domain-containing protein